MELLTMVVIEATQRAQHNLANFDKLNQPRATRARLIAEHELRVAQMEARAAVARCKFYLLYWCNSARTDAEGAAN